MIINADFALKAVVHTQTMPWEKSPIEGVERKYLDRVGCLLYTSPSPRDRQKSRMPSSA